MLQPFSWEEAKRSAEKMQLLPYLKTHLPQHEWATKKLGDEESYGMLDRDDFHYNLLDLAVVWEDKNAVLAIAPMCSLEMINRVDDSPSCTLLSMLAETHEMCITCFKILLASGAKIQVGESENALHEALESKNNKAARILIENGAIINEHDLISIADIEILNHQERVQNCRQVIITLLVAKKRSKNFIGSPTKRNRIETRGKFLTLIKYDRFIIHEIAKEIWTTRGKHP